MQTAPYDSLGTLVSRCQWPFWNSDGIILQVGVPNASRVGKIVFFDKLESSNSAAFLRNFVFIRHNAVRCDGALGEWNAVVNNVPLSMFRLQHWRLWLLELKLNWQFVILNVY